MKVTSSRNDNWSGTTVRAREDTAPALCVAYLRKFLRGRNRALERFQGNALLQAPWGACGGSDAVVLADLETKKVTTVELLQASLRILMSESMGTHEKDVTRCVTYFQKKYEIRLQLHQAYDATGAALGAVDELAQGYLALALLRLYRVTRNLKHLNTVLKVNDALVRIKVTNPELRQLVHLSLTWEQEIVHELCEAFGFCADLD